MATTTGSSLCRAARRWCATASSSRTCLRRLTGSCSPAPAAVPPRAERAHPTRRGERRVASLPGARQGDAEV